MLIKDLIPEIQRVLRDTTAPYQFDNNDLLLALKDGIGDMNIEYHQQYKVTGSSDQIAISPEPDTFSKRIWVLMSAIQLLQGEKVKASATALSISMPSGRTDLQNIPEAIRDAVSMLQDRLNNFLRIANQYQIEMSSREKTRQQTT